MRGGREEGCGAQITLLQRRVYSVSHNAAASTFAAVHGIDADPLRTAEVVRRGSGPVVMLVASESSRSAQI